MSFATVLTLAVGLAMDAMAVAAAEGLRCTALRRWHALRMALVFGAFQAVMPVIGWAIGARFEQVIEAWDHWVAFALLSGIGAKMIHEARRSAPGERPPSSAPLGAAGLFVLGVATSIDALVAGLTLPLLDLPIVFAAATIGVTTAALSAAGVSLGRRFGARLGSRLDVFGGLLLVLLGVKALVDHTLRR